MSVAMGNDDVLRLFASDGYGALHRDRIVRFDNGEVLEGKYILIEYRDFLRELSIFTKLGFGIVVAANERDMAIEARQDLANGFGETHDEVAENMDLVGRHHSMIPPDDHIFPGLPRTREGAVAVLNDVFVVEMLVRGKKDHVSSTFANLK